MSRIAILLLASLAIAFSLPLKHYSEFSSLSTKTYKQSNAVCPNVSADGVNYIGRAGLLPTSASLTDGACSWYKDSTCCDPADAQFIRCVGFTSFVVSFSKNLLPECHRRKRD